MNIPKSVWWLVRHGLKYHWRQFLWPLNTIYMKEELHKVSQ